MKMNNSSIFTVTLASRLGMKAPWLAGVVLLLLALTGCSTKGKAVRSIPADDREFLSEVRYIISKKEIKIFKKTPPAERQQFIEEFWKVRDPDPTTEENEYRDEYYRRIELANHLFQEGSQGWLSDRGRILILLGEPERRDVYPTGYSFYEPPVEIWFYGTFPVVFVDTHREGMYRLDPGSARRISIINNAQMQLKPQGLARNVRMFDFSLTAPETGPGQARLQIDVPYRVTNLLLNDKTKTYETRLRLNVRIVDAAGAVVLEKEEFHPIAVSDEMLKQLGKHFAIEFPLPLPAGKYTAQVTLENTADKSQSRKEIKIKL